MAYEFRFPDVGEGITEGELLSWKVGEGEVITEDQTLAEIETDKAVVEIPSPKAGKIVKLHAQEGEIIKVGAVLVTIEEAAAAEPTVGAPSAVPGVSPAGEAGAPVVGFVESGGGVLASREPYEETLIHAGGGGSQI